MVLSLEIHTGDYEPLKGSSYIHLIMRKKAILNIENKDNHNCFMWSILRFLRPINLNSTRINDLKQYENDLNFKGIDFPVKVKDITKSEKQNSNIPKVNVLSMNKIKSTH